MSIAARARQFGYLVHVTKREHIPSILAHGVQPGGEGGGRNDVFMTPWPIADSELWRRARNVGASVGRDHGDVCIYIRLNFFRDCRKPTIVTSNAQL